MVDQVTRIRTGPWLGRTVSAVSLLTVGVFDWLNQGAFAPFYTLPVALSALGDGWRGGLATAVLSSIAVFTRSE